jgi:hypothetical protein
MTEQQHPITPPPELVQQWRNEGYSLHSPVAISTYVATRAAQWGADQANADIERKLQDAADEELEACRQWLEINGAPSELIDGLLVARCCSEPPSLKEQALEELDAAILRGDCFSTSPAKDTIRRALESIPDPS